MPFGNIFPSTLPASLSDAYVADEDDTLAKLVTLTTLTADDRAEISSAALALVATIRSEGRPVPLMDALLQEYGLSTEEGVALMRLSEALIRTPDFTTSRKLIRDKLIDADWDEHAWQAPDFLVNQATNGLRLSSGWVKASGGLAASNIASRLGDRVLGLAMNRVMTVMAEHFVLGRSIEDAAKNAGKSKTAQTFSFDMLGEAALTEADADSYFSAYKHAVTHLASKVGRYARIADAPGISVKLSALHPRYAYATREICLPVLIERLITLARIAKGGGLSLAIDAEETDRLELSLLLFGQLLKAPELADWDGLGLVVQAYQRRAVPTLQHVISAARTTGRRITVRLVKGAYWDSEVKRAQEIGLESYPVFTRKENTDVSFLACARLMLDASDVIFPQFATHNAHTAAAIAYMARCDQPYEIQRLHGMGKSLHEALTAKFGTRSRVYAPVGAHEDLLPYLVRRLLENGANSSFVNQIFDKAVDADQLIADPITKATANAMATHPNLPHPRTITQDDRLSARGLDLTQARTAEDAEAAMILKSPVNLASGSEMALGQIIEIKNPANPTQIIGTVQTHDITAVSTAIERARASNWATHYTAAERGACLDKAADLLEKEMHGFLRMCVLEAGKTLPDAVAEVREAVDFLRYYAREARTGPAAKRAPLGVVACISPWNFPLAIFLGQISAVLSVGNTAVAKPAPQTPLISMAATDLLKRAGVPADAVHLLLGDGALLGNALTGHSGVKAVCFTGSTPTARRIAMRLAETGRGDTPFIAETGGINTMLVDSTALLQQAVKDVITSAFQSAGQRCSACRIVCVQDDIAEDFITMLSGAMDALTLGDPARIVTDIGPVIDAGAREMLETYIKVASSKFRLIKQVPPGTLSTQGHFVSPVALEIKAISDVPREIFGPVLHVLRFRANDIENLIDAINATGFGLTMGLHTRLDHRIETIAARAHVGNLYVNRNQIGAVVGTQPFGGEGLSGTGPKAGGPHYLLRLSTPDMQEVPARVSSERAQFTAKIRALFARTALSNSLLWQRATLPLERTLPGPTGEQNTLKLHPRGTLLCLGGDTPDQLAEQIALCLISGNKVVARTSPTTIALITELKRALAEAKFPADTLTDCSEIEVEALLDGPLDGVALEGAGRPELAARLVRREGPLLPLLSAREDPVRFYHERTVTINTTAAGGNASLLAMT